MREECAVKAGERKGMKESDTEDPASHGSPESRAEVGNDARTIATPNTMAIEPLLHAIKMGWQS